MYEEKTKIMLIDQHQLFREGVKRVLKSEAVFDVIVSSDNYSVVTPLIEKYAVDVLLIDVKTFMQHKTEITENILHVTSAFKVIVLSSEGEENFVTEAVKAGVHGYLLKEMDIYSFIDAIKAVVKGVSYIHPIVTSELVADYRKMYSDIENEVDVADVIVQKPLHLYTKRECEVLQLLANGQSNRRVAETLNISEKTVKNHVSSLFKKMKVNDRTQAVVTAIRNHWVEI